jgi:hypothetical protein
MIGLVYRSVEALDGPNLRRRRGGRYANQTGPCQRLTPFIISKPAAVWKAD